jgi:class 3 adenylate cyclase
MAEWPEREQQAPFLEGGQLYQRVADADRDRTITMLREHVVEGRLTLDEFSERVGLALEAKTRGDLESVMANLPTDAPATPEVSTRKSRRWHIAVMSGSDTKGRWRISGKTNAVAVMGGCNLDLRRAEIDGPEVVITAVAFWGGVQITVPEGFDVDLEGFSFMGGRSLKLRDVPRVPGSPRIRIRGFSIMGGIDVRSKPNRSGRTLVESVLDGVQGVVDALPPTAGPVDLATLGADIRRQMRSHRHGGGHRHSERPPDSRAESGRAETARAETAQPPPSDGTVTILFSDMVNYAGMTERLGDQASREVLREHHRVVRTMLERHGGREIKVQGDGFMVAFGGVARALRCAVDVQRAFRSYSEDHLDRPIQVHIGVHTGDAVQEDDDYLGHTVIVASRLANEAGPGQILVSSLSEQLVQGTGEFTFIEHRETVLKGMSRAQSAAALDWD